MRAQGRYQRFVKALRNFARREDGVSFLEMALVTPFLIILSLGMFEFGNVFYQHQLIASGVRDAGRYLARWNDNDPATNDCGNPTAAEAAAKLLAVNGTVVGGTKRVSWWNTGDITITYRNTDANDPGTGARIYSDGCPLVKTIIVTTNVSYPGLGFLNILGLGPTMNFTLRHEERRIRN